MSYLHPSIIILLGRNILLMGIMQKKKETKTLHIGN